MANFKFNFELVANQFPAALQFLESSAELLWLQLLDLSLKSLIYFRLELIRNICSTERACSLLLQKLIAALYAVLVATEWLQLAGLDHQVIAYVAVKLSQ